MQNESDVTVATEKQNDESIIRKCYEELASEYDDPAHASIQYNENLEEPEILRIMGKTDPSGYDSFLDLGCGTGRWLKRLYEIGYKDLAGIDISANMIKEAKKKFGDLPYTPLFIEGMVEDIDSLFPPERFNYVLAPFCDHISAKKGL